MMVSRKDSFSNALNNRSDHPTNIEDAPDLPSLEIEKLSLFQQLEWVEKEMEKAPNVLSLAVADTWSMYRSHKCRSLP